MALSKTRIDKLGERFRLGEPTEADLRELDEYRRSFGPAYDNVVRKIRNELKLDPSGRVAKTTPSIVEQLRRESIRLSQMQDIAGCRSIVSNRADQDGVTDALGRCFADVDVVDRRQKSSHGYRAIHVIVREQGRPVEVQVRTALQHLWAQYSENLSDWADPSIKYGGGPASLAEALLRTSDLIARIESHEQKPLGIEHEQLPDDPVAGVIDSLLLLLTVSGGIIRKK